jgi:hypothetical protein
MAARPAFTMLGIGKVEKRGAVDNIPVIRETTSKKTIILCPENKTAKS